VRSARPARCFASPSSALADQGRRSPVRRDIAGLCPSASETSARIVAGAFPLHTARPAEPHDQALLGSAGAHRWLVWGSKQSGHAIAWVRRGHRREFALGEQRRQVHVLPAVRTPVRTDRLVAGVHRQASDGSACVARRGTSDHYPLLRLGPGCDFHDGSGVGSLSRPSRSRPAFLLKVRGRDVLTAAPGVRSALSAKALLASCRAFNVALS